MKLPDGNYRCPRCMQTFPQAAMTAENRYCRPCWADVRRTSYARRLGGLKRPRKHQMPADFSERAGKVADVTLAGLYGVSYVTVRKWRRQLGIPPLRHDYVAMGRAAMAKLRAEMPERATGSERARKAVAVREAKRAKLDAELDSSGRVIPMSKGSTLAEANIAADLYAQALRALATSPPVPVWEREEWA